ncbi:MAG: DUF1254 domain-containing protein [Rubrivivax sp.]
MRSVITEEEAYAIGVEACIYAYPMVLMALSLRVATNVAAPDGVLQRAPLNRFAHAVAYKNATHRDVVRPNADTLYSRAWFDLGREPLVLTLPDTQGRYHVVPVHDMWTDVFATLGTRTTGNAGGRFALVGPRWQGSLPPDLRPIVCPTEQGWILGRIQANGPDDYAFVHRLQAGLEAVPLSAWGRPHDPPPSQVDVGAYGNDYLLRAFVAYAGLGALPNEEAIYPMAAADAEGKPLTGASRYVLHFDKDHMPPADAFWSLTMYGADQFFVANRIGRYAIGDRDKLAFNADGSLDLYIQHESPGRDQESNWLPAPAGPSA